MERVFNPLAKKGFDLVSDGGSSGEDALTAANNLSDLADKPTARTNLGFGDGVLPSLNNHVQRIPTEIVTLFQSGHGWTTSGQVSSEDLNDTVNFVKGTQSAQVTTNGNGGGGANLQKLSDLNLDLTDKVIKVILKVDDIEALSQLNLLVGTNDSFSNNFKWQMNVLNASSSLIQSNEWITLLFSWADVHSAGGTFSLDSERNPSSTSGFTKMRFQVVDANTPLTFNIQSVEIIDNLKVDFPNGVVSIVFDDSWADTFSLAKPVMDTYGYRGTAYTIADIIGDADRMTLQQLKDMQDLNGWEIGGHAFSKTLHDNRYTSATSAAVDADLRNLKNWLDNNGLRGTSFAYPGGFFERTTDDISIESLVGRYFSSGRTVLTGYGASSNLIAEQAPSPRPLRLLAQSGISEDSSGPDLPSFYVGDGGELDTCMNLGSWLILTFHKVVDDTPADTTEVSLDGFTDIIEAINARGIEVLPVQEVMARYMGRATTSKDVANAGATMNTDTDVSSNEWVLDEDTLSSNSDTKVPTQQSVKSYVDAAEPPVPLPGDVGYKAWTFDGSLGITNNGIALGTIYLCAIYIREAVSITDFWFAVNTAVTSPTSGQNWVGLYDSSGARVVQASLDAVMTSNGPKQVTVSSTPLTPGRYWIAFVFNGSGAPQLFVGNAQGTNRALMTNGPAAAASARYAVNGTGATSLPTSITPASNDTDAGDIRCIWAAVS